MISRTTPPDSDAGNPGEYFDALRQKNYDASFDGVQDFIAANGDRIRQRRRKKPLRKWQWMLAVLLPVLVILACTKTEHIEPVGNAVSFSVPQNDDAARQGLEKVVGGLQTVVAPDKQKPGYLSYTCFIPAQSNRPAGTVIGQLQAIKGISGLTTVPMNTQVKESLLSQLGYKVFRTHIDASAMRDDEMQSTVMRQLREQGITDISVSVVRNEHGVRTLALHPAEGASNYSVDVSVDDKGTRMVLQEEKRTIGSGSTDKPPVDFKSMTDAQVRDYMRQQHGSQLRDEDIHITRTAQEIAIRIRQSDQQEEIMRFRFQ